MSFRLFAMAAILAFVVWQLRRNAFEFDVGRVAVWVTGGLCALGVAASVAGAFDEARLSRANAVALVLNGFGALISFLQP